MTVLPPFIHLRVHSAYSLLQGAIHLKPLVKWAAAEHMPAVGVADFGNLFGSLEFALAAMDAGIQPIHGCVMCFRPSEEGQARGGRLKPEQLLVIAQNETGWQNLLKLVSKSYLAPAGDEAPLLAYEDLEGRTDGLIALSGGVYGGIGRALLSGRDGTAECERLASLFPGRFYIELMRHGMPDEAKCEPGFIRLALAHNLPLVATNDAYFMNESMYEAHDAFLCIAEGTYVGEEDRRRLTPNHRLKTTAEMCALFADIPEALENTVAIARRCSVMASARAPMLPRFTLLSDVILSGAKDLVAAGISDEKILRSAQDDENNMSEPDILRQQAREGLELRLVNHVFKEGMSEEEKAEIAKPYRERLEFEIETIIGMKFPGYFLIVSDFIKWSKSQGIPVGPGRGSGAGSLVAWALFITDLDPLRFGLLFERFLNPQRVSMPDFDVDFCQDRRDEVISYVQQRYGRDRVAQIITFGKLQARAVLRDVGRVLQMPYGQVDRISKLVPNNPANPVTLKDAIGMEPMLQAAIKEDEAVDKLVDMSLKLEGLNRHASTHAAGVVIADRELDELVPLYRDPRSDMPVVQYSMKYAEAAGLVKFDFLGLKTLTVLVKAVEMIAKRGVEIDLLKLPEGDPATYALLGRGETVGVFQLEGAGMRDTVRKLKPDMIEDIIALVSLYRPGPMDNIPTYIARKHGQEEPDYLHPRIAPILKETYGVIIYQEQVMQIAQVLAGYSLGEADLLRRAMGKKIRAEMEAQRSIFVEKAVESGVEKAQAANIFDLIAKFAEYGFNKSHAAAYALIAYQTAYLKANHPVEFFAASMNYDMHNTDKLGIFREDAGKRKIKLLPPDINKSGVLFEVEGGNIRYALAAVRNVGAQAMQLVVEEREKNGPYASLFDLCARVQSQALNKRALEHLVKAGAFDSIHASRAQLMEALDMALAYGAHVAAEKESAQVSLFGGADGSAIPEAPPLPNMKDWPTLEKLHHEFGAIGFYLSSHPLESYRKGLQSMGVTSSAKFADRLGEKYIPLKVAGIVTGRKFKVSDKGRFAFVQMSDMGGVYEITIYSEELLGAHREKLEPGRVLLVGIDGKMEEAGARLIATSIQDLEAEMSRRPQASSAKLKILVDRAAAIAPIKGLLGQAAPMGASVLLTAQVNGGKAAEIRLPGKYAVTPLVLDQLKVVPGVVTAEEMA